MTANNIILGDGVFAVDGVDIALTRGGGSFNIEREYRQIEADGDYGPVKGRIRKRRSVAKLTVRALQLLPDNLPKLFPATSNTEQDGTDTWTAKTDVETDDYQSTVTWTGKTKGGRPVVITLNDAINLESIEWPLVDKDEVVPELTYSAAYDPNDRETEPWNVTYAPVEDNPIVLTAAAAVTGTDTATLNGELDSLGGETAVDVYFQYKKAGTPVWYYTTDREELSTTTTFDANITGLETDTQYQFRAVVEWGTDAAYGAVLTFTTDSV